MQRSTLTAATRFAALSLTLLMGGLLGLGCGDNRRNIDSGRPVPTTDSGLVIMLQDSGGRDSGTSIPIRDSGTTTPPTGDACTLTSLSPLPSSCLPRCTAATRSAAVACEDNTCFSAALDADTTPPATVTLPDGPEPFYCNDCFGWQQATCFADICPSEYSNFATCSNAGGACTSEGNALDVCADAAGDSFDSCFNTRVEACFGA